MCLQNKRYFPIALRALAAAALAAGLGACGAGAGMAPPQLSNSNAKTLSVSQADAYSSAVMADSPTAYYRLDDSGTTASDSSGNALNGTIGSTVVAASGLIASSSDAAKSFSGTRTSSGVVHVAQNKALQPSNAVSMELLLRFSATPSTYVVPMSYGTDSGTAPYDFYFLGGHIVAQFGLTGGALLVKSPSALQTNRTYHIAATFDGSTGRLYINGTLVASASKTGSFTGYASGYGLAIGDDAGYSDPAFKGTIDDVAVYAGKALSGSRVAAHYAATNATAASPAPSPSATPRPTTAPTSTPAASPTPVPTATAKPTTAPTTTPTTAPTTAPTIAPTTAAYVYHGCQVYPTGDLYANQDISAATPSANSAAIISHWAGTGNFDYGDDAGSEAVNLATNSTPQTVVQYNGGHNPPMTNGAGTTVPWQSGFRIEGTAGQNSDGHVSTLNTQTCVDSEMSGAAWNGSTLGAFGGMNVNLGTSYSSQYSLMGPITVAYIPLLGFTDYGEDASATSINHPLSFFTPGSGSLISKNGYYYPAHSGYASVGSCTSGNNCLHLGDYIRLKASFDCSVYTHIGQLVCNQLKHYGAVYDDDAYHLGFRFGLSSDGSNPWNYSTNLQPLFKALTMQDFDVIENGSMHCSGSPCV